MSAFEPKRTLHAGRDGAMRDLNRRTLVTSRALVVDDYGELLALHKGLMEARFSDLPNNFYVSGSPLLADLHKRLVAILAARDVEAGHAPERWDHWLVMAEGRREWVLALNNVRNDSSWAGLDEAERISRARDYLSPFVVTEEALRRFLLLTNSVDSR